MGPKLLGGGASLLATVFILALPSVFKGEPADEVEPIRFGPPPVAKLAQAVQVIDPRPAFPPPPPAIPTATQLAISGSRNEGDHAAAGSRGASARGPGNDLRPEGDENESQGGTSAGNRNSADEDENADLDDVDDDADVGWENDVGEDEEVSEDNGDDVGEDEDD